jgi:hypothetical protein
MERESAEIRPHLRVFNLPLFRILRGLNGEESPGLRWPEGGRGGPGGESQTEGPLSRRVLLNSPR